MKLRISVPANRRKIRHIATGLTTLFKGLYERLSLCHLHRLFLMSPQVKKLKLIRIMDDLKVQDPLVYSRSCFLNQGRNGVKIIRHDQALNKNTTHGCKW